MMTTKNFKVGDLVFAKLKGYPAWPAVITNSIEKLKSSSNKCKLYCVYFFGSRNYGFLKSDTIFSYEKNKEGFKIKTAGFEAALNEIEDYKKGYINVYFPKIDSESRFIEDCFVALKKEEDETGYSNIFSLNHINITDLDKSQDISKLDNLLSGLRKLENDKGDENNCFTKRDELHNKHNSYPESKLVYSFLDLVNKFEDYVYTENKDAFDDPSDLEFKNKIRELDSYSAVIKNIEEYMYGRTNVFNPDSKDFLNEPSSSNDFQNEISLEDMFLTARKEMKDYLKTYGTILNATKNDMSKKPSVNHKYNEKLIQLSSLLNDLNVFKDLVNNLTSKNKEISNKPTTKDECEKKSSDINRNVSKEKNEVLFSKPSCSKMFQNKKLDVHEEDKHFRKHSKISSKENSSKGLIGSQPCEGKVVNKLRRRLSSENNKELPEENIHGNLNCVVVLERLNLSPVVLVKRLKQ